jgi:hypothetical protein
MPTTSISQGEPVYVRAYSTKRAAIAALLTVFPSAGGDWGQVRLVTDWYDWDEAADHAGRPLRAGEVLQLEAFRLEAIRQ